MTERYELSSVRETEDGKKFWTRVGTMFPHRDGEGFSILLDAVPAPQDGQYRIVARTPREREDRQDNGRGRSDDRRSGGRQQRGGGWNAPADDLDDEIPF